MLFNSYETIFKYYLFYFIDTRERDIFFNLRYKTINHSIYFFLNR